MGTEKKYLKLWQKIIFGWSAIGNNYCWTFTATYAMLYMTDVAGINAAAIGTVMMFSKVLDGISDVIMGKIIDGTKSKMGKARFWMTVSTIPLALSVYFLFNIPANFTENTKTIYVFIVYTLMGAVFFTMNSLANYTLIPLVTKNPREQVDLQSSCNVWACLGIIVMTSITTKIVDAFGGGQTGWRAVSIIYAIIVAVTIFVVIFSVKEIPEEENAVESVKQGYSFIEMVKLLLTNKYFIIMTLYYLGMHFSNGIHAGMGAYYAAYNLGDGSLYGILSMASMLPLVICSPFAGKIHEKFGSMRKASFLGLAFGLVGALVTFFGCMVGNFVLVCAGMVVKAIGCIPFSSAVMAFLAETAVNIRLKKGVEMTGAVMSASSIGIKVGAGLGTAACGFMLNMGGYVGGAAVQSEQALNTIWLGYGGGFLLTVLVMVITTIFMKVEEENKQLREAQKLAQ